MATVPLPGKGALDMNLPLRMCGICFWRVVVVVEVYKMVMLHLVIYVVDSLLDLDVGS